MPLVLKLVSLEQMDSMNNLLIDTILVWFLMGPFSVSTAFIQNIFSLLLPLFFISLITKTASKLLLQFEYKATTTTTTRGQKVYNIRARIAGSSSSRECGNCKRRKEEEEEEEERESSNY